MIVYQDHRTDVILRASIMELQRWHDASCKCGTRIDLRGQDGPNLPMLFRALDVANELRLGVGPPKTEDRVPRLVKLLDSINSEASA